MPIPEEIAAQETARVEAAKAAEEAAAKLAEDEAQKKEAESADFETWLAKQPKEIQDRFSKHTNGLKSALEKERLSSKELTKAQKRLKELDEAEAKRKEAELSETEKLIAKLADAEKNRLEAETTLQTERAKAAAEKSFNAVIVKLNLTFANDKARENVFKQLDITKPEEYEAEVKKIMTDEPYYFKATEIPDLDATQKGKQKNGVLNDAQKAELKKRFRIK